MKREDEAGRTVLLQEVCGDEDVRLTELFLLAARGDEGASREFWGSERWREQLKRDCEFICWRYPLPGGDLQSDAEDLAQRTRMRMVEKGAQFGGRASVRTWSMCIAKRLHFREFTKRQRERQSLRAHPCEASRQLSDEVPGVRLAVMEVWDDLPVWQKELYEVFLQCGDAWEVAEVSKGSQWVSMSEREQLNERNRIARVLTEVGKKLVRAAEVKWLTALGQQDKGANDAPIN